MAYLLLIVIGNFEKTKLRQNISNFVIKKNDGSEFDADDFVMNKAGTKLEL